LVRATVDLYGGSRATLRLEPAPSRWPEHEISDRLTAGLGLAALALARAGDSVSARVRSHVMRLAAELAEQRSDADDGVGDWAERVAGVAIVDSEEIGRPRVELQVVSSAVGPVPTVGRASPASLTLAAAAGVVLAASLEGDDEDELRLAAALALEGLLGWYREVDPHLQPPQQALAYAFRYAASRLEEVGRIVPPGLGSAVAAHRRISPMAGGAA
jgi:hypothetical protein